jgi:hypothetical protein
MTRKSAVGLLAAGALIGMIAMALIQRAGRAHAPVAPPTVEPAGNIAALRAEYDPQISRLTAENEALRAAKNAGKPAAENTPSSGLLDGPDREFAAPG